MSISLKIIGLKCFSSKSIGKSILVFPIHVKIKATETGTVKVGDKELFGYPKIVPNVPYVYEVN